MSIIRKGLVGIAAVATIAVGANAATGGEDADTTNHAEQVIKDMEADANAKPAADDKAPAEEKQKPEEPKYTSSQEQAIGSASDYLDYGSFSKKGLADQLKFEEFSKADAAFAVNHIDVDWNAQAAGSAKDYLDTGSFSHGGLVDQLVFEGFTAKQAEYGVTKAGL